MAFRGVFKARAEPGHAFKAVLRQRPAFIRPDNRVCAAVDQIGVRIIQINSFPHAAQLELGVERLVRIHLVGVGAEDDDAFAGRQGHGREQETDAVAPVAQPDVLQVDLVIGAVPELDPVAVIAVLIGHRSVVGRHDLADHKALIPRQLFAVLGVAGFGAGGIGGAADRFLGRHDDQQHHSRREAQHEQQIPAGFSAPELGGTGSRTASGHTGFSVHGLPSFIRYKYCNSIPYLVFFGNSFRGPETGQAITGKGSGFPIRSARSGRIHPA